MFSTFRLVELVNDGVKVNFTSYIDLCKLFDFRPLQQRSKWSIFLDRYVEFFWTCPRGRKDKKLKKFNIFRVDFFRLLDLSTTWKEV